MTFTTRPTLQGTFGMVSSTHWLATATAMSVLEQGGNAFDAAVAGGFVLHVVEPHYNGPGGEVPAIISVAGDPQPHVLVGQGPAPGGASIGHYRAQGLDLVPGAGPLAAAVPGAVDAWLLLLRDYGTMHPSQVLHYAIDYAGAGHPIVEAAVTAIRGVEGLFRDDWTTSADLWLQDGHTPTAGSLVTNPAWAATLARLVDEAEAAGPGREAQIDAARKAWGEGFVAEAIDRFSRRPFLDSSGERHPGVLTGADMAAWSATWEAPTTYDWRGFTLAKTGPWGQGPVLLQTLALIQAAGGGEVPDPGTAAGVHLAAECLKLAMADREAWYGDSGTAPLDGLLSPAYNAERARLIGELASAELRPGAPAGAADPVLGALARSALAPAGTRTNGTEYAGWSAAGSGALRGTSGEPVVPGPAAAAVMRGDTCHLDVVDRWGNMISATPSGGWLQSSPTVPELGFCLGSRLQMTWLEEGLASSLTPGRRPRTTLSPTLVLRDGEPVLACGTPGGDQQDQWQLSLLLRHLGAGMPLQEAIDAPAWHTNSFPSSFHPRGGDPASLFVEDRLGDEVIADLEGRGHQVTRTGPWSEGRLSAVARHPETGVVSAGANPRGMQGYAAGR